MHKIRQNLIYRILIDFNRYKFFDYKNIMYVKFTESNSKEKLFQNLQKFTLFYSNDFRKLIIDLKDFLPLNLTIFY